MLTGSVSQAARNMYRTQPAVSMALSSLEDELQTRLFDRVGGRMRPRSEAVILFERLRPVMEQLEDIRAAFSKQSSIGLPQVSIVSANNVGTHLIPSCIGDLVRDRFSVRLMNGSAARIVSDMEGQLRDIAVADEGAGIEISENPLFEFESFRVPICAVFREGLVDAGDRIASAVLREHPVFSLYREHQVGQRTAHLVNSPELEFQNFFPMACHALQTDGIALVDRITCSAIDALVTPTLKAQWRLLEEDLYTLYYLMRPRYRVRSEASDACYNAIRHAMAQQANE